MKKSLFAVVALGALITCPIAFAKNLIVAVDSRNVVTAMAGGSTYYIVDLSIPEDVVGKRLDAVLLEFFVDVTRNESIEFEYQPTIEVFPLLEPPQGGASPRFDKSYPTTQSVTTEPQQHLIFDITEIVKSWIAEPTGNHGLIIGSFSEPRAGGLVLRNDLLGGGKAIRATFFYQNRFGRRSK